MNRSTWPTKAAACWSCAPGGDHPCRGMTIETALLLDGVPLDELSSTACTRISIQGYPTARKRFSASISISRPGPMAKTSFSLFRRSPVAMPSPTLCVAYLPTYVPENRRKRRDEQVQPLDKRERDTSSGFTAALGSVQMGLDRPRKIGYNRNHRSDVRPADSRPGRWEVPSWASCLS
jgi:hypothetical protein